MTPTLLELTTADRHQGTDPEDPGIPIAPSDNDYVYDNIANRKQYTLDAESLYYCTNPLNQYEATSATEGCEEPLEGFTFDLDGNMAIDVNPPAWTYYMAYEYTWDAENRLVEVFAPSIYSCEGDLLMRFAYDYMGRRIRKQVLQYPWNGESCEAPLVIEDQRFVYDGWNVVMVLQGLDLDNDEEPDNTVMRKYTWGLDLSGTLHGAGGIGGLLASEEPQTVGDPKRHWFLYDGNGNVGQLLKYVAGDPPTVTLAAHYEYDPYGNTIRADNVDGSGVVITNPFRFSTKWFDPETDLYYYGYRYYSPRLGRWMSRDPVGEQGGLNLYSFVANDTPNTFDPTGEHIIGVGIAHNFVQTHGLNWLGTLNELAAFEQSLYDASGVSRESRYTNKGPLDYFDNPALSFVFPDWGHGIDGLTGRVDDFTKYYEKTRRKGCKAEILHILGFSDGATVTARWLNAGAPGTRAIYVPSGELPYGTVGLVDMVRMGDPPFLGNLPNYSPNESYAVSTSGYFDEYVSFSSEGGLWKGYRITGGWSHFRFLPPQPRHDTVAYDERTKAALRAAIKRSVSEELAGQD